MSHPADSATSRALPCPVMPPAPRRESGHSAPRWLLAWLWFILVRVMVGVDRVAGWLNSVAGFIASLLTSALVLVTCTHVAMRYVLSGDNPLARWWGEMGWARDSILTQELQAYLFAIIFMLAAGWTLRHDRHVRVDVIYQRFGPRVQAAVNMIGAVLLLGPLVYLLISSGWTLTMLAYKTGESSVNPDGLKRLWPIKAVIPIAGVLLGAQGLALFCRSFLMVCTGWEPPKPGPVHANADGAPPTAEADAAVADPVTGEEATP